MSVTWYEQSGTKPPRSLTHPRPRRGLRKPRTADRPYWALFPKVIDIHGQDIEVFFIGALAVALNVSVVTVRRWERLGLLPKAPLRLEHQRARHTTRVYSDVMLDQAAGLAEVYEIGPFRRPTEAFRNDLEFCWARAFAALQLTSTVLQA
jgi:hypothetical protein